MNTDRIIQYQYAGILTIKKSRILKENVLPGNDIVPWLFLVMDKEGKTRYTFFYKIEKPSEAFYEKPFDVQMYFIMDGMEKIIKLGQIYDVWRGEEPVGIIIIKGSYPEINSQKNDEKVVLKNRER
jgi:hypothetical protein